MAVRTPRPADAPFLHLTDTRRRVLAQRRRERLVAKTAAGGERIVEMRCPVVGTFLSESRGDRHLRHDRGAAAADEALVGEEHPLGPGARRRERGVHSSAAGADNQDLGLDMGHPSDFAPCPSRATIGTA